MGSMRNFETGHGAYFVVMWFFFKKNVFLDPLKRLRKLQFFFLFAFVLRNFIFCPVSIHTMLMEPP